MKPWYSSLLLISIALLSFGNLILIASDHEQKSNTRDSIMIDSSNGLYQEHAEVTMKMLSAKTQNNPFLFLNQRIAIKSISILATCVVLLILAFKEGIAKNYILHI